jgi:hypothetical protein
MGILFSLFAGNDDDAGVYKAAEVLDLVSVEMDTTFKALIANQTEPVQVLLMEIFTENASATRAKNITSVLVEEGMQMREAEEIWDVLFQVFGVTSAIRISIPYLDIISTTDACEESFSCDECAVYPDNPLLPIPFLHGRDVEKSCREYFWNKLKPSLNGFFNMLLDNANTFELLQGDLNTIRKMREFSQSNYDDDLVVRNKVIGEFVDSVELGSVKTVLTYLPGSSLLSNFYENFETKTATEGTEGGSPPGECYYRQKSWKDEKDCGGDDCHREDEGKGWMLDEFTEPKPTSKSECDELNDATYESKWYTN